MQPQMTPLITDYLRSLVYWTKDKPSRSNYHFIVEQLGPTVLGIKPSELLNVSLYDERIWEEFKALFSQQEQLGLREIRQVNVRQQVLFYHRITLDSILREKHNQAFLGTINYPKTYSLDIYLNHIIEKIRSKEFPHEIGIFLGYPLKDVLGFMKRIPFTYVETKGWRIYGDSQSSYEIYDRYHQALTSRLISQFI